MVGECPRLGDIRPISIGPVVYRLWSSLRLHHVSSILKQVFGRHQLLNVYDALLTLHLEYDEDSYPYAMCLDFTKCFDSMDSLICVSLLFVLCDLVAAQWSCHRQWLSFGNVVSAAPSCSPLSLPQGDPWSPCALMVSWLLPLRRQRAPPYGCACPPILGRQDRFGSVHRQS